MAGPATKDGSVDYRTRMLRRGPGHPGSIEQARDPRRALLGLLPYLRPFRLTLAVVFVLVFVATLLGLAGPYLLGRAIDQYIGTGDAAGLATIAAVMLGVFLAGNVADAIAGWLVARVSQSGPAERAARPVRPCQTLPLRFFDTHPAGELMSRLTNDIDAINAAVSQNVVALLASVLSLVGISWRCSCSTSGWRWRRCWSCRSCSGSPTSSPATRARASASCRRPGRAERGDGRSDQRAAGDPMFRRNESVAEAFREHNERYIAAAVGPTPMRCC
jgi:hypothetical protein